MYVSKITLMEGVKQTIKEKVLFYIKAALSIALKNRIFKNLWNVFFQFDIQGAEIVMGAILSTSIFGWDNTAPFVPYGNFFVVYFTILGLYTIYTALDMENEKYLWNRIRSQFFYFITSMLVMCIIHGWNLDGKNHGGEGAMVFWYLPPITSLFFMVRNYLDLKTNLRKQKKYGL